MLTKMIETDGPLRVILPLLAALEALHYLSINNITWRGQPERYEHWNRVWKRFLRLSKSGAFDILANLSTSPDLVRISTAPWCVRIFKFRQQEQKRGV